MGDIVTKLNLNKTPKVVENNSLVYARNIKISTDGIVADNVLEEINLAFENNNDTDDLLAEHIVSEFNNILGQVVGLNNIIYFFVEHITIDETAMFQKKYTAIVEYDEIKNTAKVLNTNWKYSGGDITGYVTTNNTNEIILTICESPKYDNGDLIPIKHINLSNLDEYKYKDESVYTQAPNIPITNLLLIDKYCCTIPNGVYQFFVRYKIKKDNYTGWIPCSKECFAGNFNLTKTIQGPFKYVNIHKDANSSFIFKVEHLLDTYKDNFVGFQLGFILSHDDEIVARSWKEFKFDVTEIYFSYYKDDITEINIDELLRPIFNIYNVKNITTFKNKLYISNYQEDDFNPTIAKNNIYLNDANKKLDTLKKEFDQTEYYKAIKDENAYIECDNKFVSKNVINSSVYADFFDSINIRNINNNLDVAIDYANIEFGSNSREYNDGDYTETLSKSNVISALTTYENVNLYDIAKNIEINLVEYKDESDSLNVDGKILAKIADNIYDASDLSLSYSSFSNKPEIIKCSPFYSIIINSNGNYQLVNVGIAFIGAGHYWGILSNKYSNGYWYLNNFGGWDLDRTGTRNNIWRAFRADTPWGKVSGNTYDVLKTFTHINHPLYNILGYNWYLIANADEKTYTHNNGLNTPFTKQNKGFWISVDDNVQKFFVNAIKYAIDNNDYDFPDRVISKIEVTYIDNTNNKVTKPIFDADFDGQGCILDYVIKFKCNKDIVPYVFNVIRPKIQGIDKDNNLYINIDDNYFKLENVKVVMVDILYLYKQQAIASFDEAEHSCLWDFYMEKYVYTYNITIKYNKNNVNNITSNEIIYDRTLLPFTDYNFYIHFVKSNGIITNGYFIGKKALNKIESKESIIYPKITNVKVPSDYSAWFISINKVGNDIAEIFNETSVSTDVTYGDCLELDTLLYSVVDNITIINDNGKEVTIDASYYPSYRFDANNQQYFGSNGNIVGKFNVNNNIFWVIINNSDNSDSPNLIKLTPYISAVEESYDNYKQLNSPGYKCSVYKLNKSKTIPTENNKGYYVSGTDIYNTKINNNNNLELSDLNDNDNMSIDSISKNIIVRSNFNLNYLSLSSDLNTVLHKNDKSKNVIIVAQSATLSDYYTLHSMYKEYTKKLFIPVSKNNITSFNNTIRVSDINQEEYYKNIYTFYPEDYYNVPQNKGRIINLFSIVNNIYVHVENSLFKFNGSNNLTSEEGEVKLNESEVFDTGITELFDAAHGFGGLYKKEHSIVTYDAYIFYDKKVNLFYSFAGDTGLNVISKDIYLFLNNLPTLLSNNYDDSNNIIPCYDFDVKLGYDYINNRVFINFIGDTNICLSYDLTSKSFISFHDINFDRAFYTRTNCYFLSQYSSSLLEENNIVNLTYCYRFDYFNDSVTDKYKNIKNTPFIKLYNTDEVKEDYISVIDIICNEDYENIKQLDSISWISSKIKSYLDIINKNSDGIYFIDGAQVEHEDYPCTEIMVYSDRCLSQKTILTDDIIDNIVHDTISIRDNNSYKYPKLNKGKWTFNYFRDIKNREKNKTSLQTNVGYIYGSDNESLIYGKYFVVRFIFKNVNFKLENINFKINRYEY